MSAAEPAGILRMIQVITAIVCFACIADTDAHKFNSRFEAVLAYGVMSFIWALIGLVIVVIQRLFITRQRLVGIILLCIDGSLIFFGFIATVICIAKFHEYLPDRIKAAYVFSFFTMVLQLGSCWFDFTFMKGPAAP